MTIFVGAIADDLTGATDLALMLARGGLRVVQVIGVPAPGQVLPSADAVVVALKSRSIAPDKAVAQSLACLEVLRAAGARRFLFKYCSTFDSTPAGNIGPVAEALLDALGESLSIVCPAFPANRRTVYLGHLFVGPQLLSDSPMRHHPITPMRDSSLLRLMEAQVQGDVDLVDYCTVEGGEAAIRSRLDQLRTLGVRFAVIDALNDGHLRTIGEAIAGMALVTGGSGIALGLPGAWRKRGLLPDSADRSPGGFSAPGGRAAVLAGSCSAATLGQIEAAQRHWSALSLDPLELAADPDAVGRALAWAEPRLTDGPVVIFSSAPPDRIAQAQEELGADRAGKIVEQALSELAAGLVALGVSRLVVAGGETSGAVIERLGVHMLDIGPEIAPGVPWTLSREGPDLALALKSGNFGGPEFFKEALEMLA